jgi:hypothetical protein
LKLIESKTIASAQSAIEFTSIPQDGTDLVLLGSTRDTRTTATYGNLNITFNGNSSNYSSRLLFAENETTVGTNSGSSESSMRFLAYSTSTPNTSNTFSNWSIYIPGYTGSTSKSAHSDSVTENNAVNGGIRNIGTGLWTNTAPIITITMTTGDVFVVGSTVSLYKITRGSDGIVTVS